MKKKSFALRLAQGSVNVSERVSWWPTHCLYATQYLAARATAGDDGIISSVREALVGGARDWERTVSSAARPRKGCSLGLMCEHAVFEAELVNSVFEGDPQGIERASSRIAKNSAAQGQRYAKTIKDFPERRFGVLLEEHNLIFMGMVESLLGNDLKLFEVQEGRRDQNSANLAAFTAEWF